MGAGQVTYLAPDGTNLVRATAVEALTLIEDHVAHRLLLHVIVEILVDQDSLLLELLLREAGSELGLQVVEELLALVLHRTARSDGVSLVVELRDDRLTQLLIVRLVAVLALYILTQLLRELDLYGAVLLDLLVSELDGTEHNLLRHLLHLTLNHEDIVDRTADHDIQVALLHLREARVDLILAVLANYANLRDRATERNVRYGQGSRSGQTGQGIGLNILLGRDQVYRYENLGVVIGREEGAQCAVDQTSRQHLAIVCLAFTLHKTARVATTSGVLLLVLDLKGHKISVGFCILGGHYRTEEHRAAHLDDHRTVGLLGQLARFDLDHATIFERNLLTDSIVQLLFFHDCFCFL